MYKFKNKKKIECLLENVKNKSKIERNIGECKKFSF